MRRQQLTAARDASLHHFLFLEAVQTGQSQARRSRPSVFSFLYDDQLESVNQRSKVVDERSKKSHHEPQCLPVGWRDALGRMPLYRSAPKQLQDLTKAATVKG